MAGRLYVPHADSVGENSLAIGYQCQAKGDYSTAIGYSARADSVSSFAFGDSAQALNVQSYAFGRGAKAIGERSFAFGSAYPGGHDNNGDTIYPASAPKSEGLYSYAFGLGSIASGEGAITLGFKVEATGPFSTAMGYKTTASKWGSTAMGNNTKASGFESMAMGSYTKASEIWSTAMGYKTTASGGASTAMGTYTKASGGASTAMGIGTDAIGASSTAMGNRTEANGENSTAMGKETTAEGENSTAMGKETTAEGENSVSMGDKTSARGENSIALGNYSIASGKNSMAVGYSSEASGDHSIAIGNNTTASKYASIALGFETKASGISGSTALGNYSEATGNYGSTALGYHTKAEGRYGSLATGYYTEAIGDYSTAMGYNIKVEGTRSFGIGLGNIERVITQNRTMAIMDGNVGIGTTSPVEILDVRGDAEFGVGVGFHDGDSEYLSIRAQSDNWYLGVKNDYYANNCDFFIGQDKTEDGIFHIQNNGNVGIGTTSPIFKLHVVDNSTSSDDPAIYGEHDVTNNYGVGVMGKGRYRGVHGIASSASAGTIAGVYGHADGGTSGNRYGVYGSASGGATAYAGYFAGNVNVTGTLSKGSGTFKIDHPLDPENKYLYHSFVESPDMMNIYNGNIVLDSKGEATVKLPDYFEALNMEFRYQLTPVGAPGPNLYIAQEISGNTFKIAGGSEGMKVSWQVTGIRHDPFAKKNRVKVEVEKDPQDKGKYLHPDVYNQAKEKGIDYQNTEEGRNKK